MKKILLILSLLILSGCAVKAGNQTTNWSRIPAQEVPGIVEIGTGWGKAPLCTGVLITNKHVITAAHCIKYPKEDTYIIYNCSDIRDSECVRIPSEEMFIHPGFKHDFSSGNDIAIVKSSTKINSTIVPISEKPLEIGMPLWVAGFGQRNDSSGILYEGLGRLSKDYNYEFVASMDSYLDPNPGDSGGPAFVWEDGQYKLFGILSRSKWSGFSKRKMRMFYHTGFAIYTKPQAYSNWINAITKDIL